MAVLFSKKTKAGVVQKVAKIIPDVARASTTVKPFFRQNQSLAKNRASRRLKNFLYYCRYRIVRSNLIKASKASRKFLPATNVVVLITKKRVEDACSIRWRRSVCKMRKTVAAVIAKAFAPNPPNYSSRRIRWKKRFRHTRRRLKPFVAKPRYSKTTFYYRKNRVLKRLALLPRQMIYNSSAVISSTQSSFLCFNRFYTSRAHKNSDLDEQNRLSAALAKRKVKWVNFLKKLKSVKFLSPLAISKFHRAYSKRSFFKRRNKKLYKQRGKKSFFKKYNKGFLKPSRKKFRKSGYHLKKQIKRLRLTKKLRIYSFKSLRSQLRFFKKLNRSSAFRPQHNAKLPSFSARIQKFFTRRKLLPYTVSLRSALVKYVYKGNSCYNKKSTRAYYKANSDLKLTELETSRVLYAETDVIPSNNVAPRLPKGVRVALMHLRAKNKRARSQDFFLRTLLKKYELGRGITAHKSILKIGPGLQKRPKNTSEAQARGGLLRRYAVRKKLRALSKLLVKTRKLKHQSYPIPEQLSFFMHPQHSAFLKFKQKVSGTQALLAHLCSKVLPRQQLRVNKRYKRVYLRRRVRASLLLKRRARLRRFAPARWPTVYEIGRPRARYSRRSHWRRRRFLEKKIVTRLNISRGLKRSAEKMLFVPKTNTPLYAFMQSRHVQLRKFLKKLPRYSPVYKLKFRRWHSYRDNLGIPLPRVWPSRAEVRRLLYTNRLRRRRGLKPKKRPDPVYYELEVGLGSMSALGYHRRRRVLQSKFNTTRWWKPSTVSGPVATSVSALSFRYPHRFNFLNYSNSTNLADAVTFRKHAKRFSLRRFKNENLYATRKYVEDNNNWRVANAVMPSAGLFVKPFWSLTKLHKVISSLSANEFSGIWVRCANVLGLSNTVRLRSNFVKQSALWLEARYSERKFTAKLSSLNSKLSPAAVKNLIILNRQKLFRTSPYWWIEEARRRLHALEFALNSFAAAQGSAATLEKVTAVLSSFSVGAAAAQDILVAEREKNLLAFMLARLPASEKEALLKNFSHNAEECLMLTKKCASSSYQFWLRGIETHMKKTIQSRSSLDHNELRSRTITLLGNERARFPGIGRRVNSYDRSLRLFYRKTTPSRFRRVQNLRFRLLRPSMFFGFYGRTSKFESSLEQRRGRRFLQPLASSSYLTYSWRRLLNRRHNRSLVNAVAAKDLSSNKHLKASVVKRRFQKLPLELTLDNTLNKQDAFLEEGRSLDALTEPLLLSAIKARLKSRRLQDLALHVNRRLLPSEQILPPRMAAGRAYKRRKARGGVEYFLPTHYEPRTEMRWSLSNFAVTVTKKRPNRFFNHTPAGEVLLEPSFVFRKRGVDKGFVLSRGTRKIRRFRKRRRYRGTLLKLKRRFKSRRILRRAKRYRKRSLFSFRALKRLAVRRALALKHKATRQFGNRLVTTTGTTFTLAPLQFVKPVCGVTASEKEKARQREGVEVLKQGHYRRASQLATTINKLFPQIISLIIDRQFASNPALNSAELRGMVNSAYWSLRFYLQKDFEGRRLSARDISRERFNLLRGQILRDSEDLYFEAPEFKLMRQRFQPYRMHCVRLSRRGSIDWLRMFFPRYHALYLEDPEAYGNFFLTPTQAMRAHPSRLAPGKWSSYKLAGSMENRFKRLINTGNLENSSRFENILMTNRRAPVFAGYGAAISMRLGGSLSSPLTPKASFFRRNYSTNSFRAFSSVPVITERVLKIQKQVANSNASLSDYRALSVKSTLKARIYAKSQTSHVETSSDVGVGSIDPRFMRMKSPRNRQFLRRLSAGNYDKTSTLRNIRLRTSLYSSAADTFSKLYIEDRKFIRPTVYCPFTSELPSVVLDRKSGAFRRAPSFLRVRAQRSLKRLVSRRTIFSSPKITKKYNMLTRVNTLGLTFLPEFSEMKSRKAISRAEHPSLTPNARSILQFRKASHRLTPLYFTKSPLIRRGAVVLRPVVSRLLFSRGLYNSITCRILKWRSSNSEGWFRKKSFALEALNLPKRQKSVRLASYRAWQEINFGSSITLRSRSNLRLKRPVKAIRFTRGFCRSKRKSMFFVSQAKLLYKNSKVATKFLAEEEQSALLNPGATRRQELWGQITLRWMKKYRFLKNWLKDMKRGLKKTNWEYMPELLFKGMRVRLRKLEWREPDRHFDRRGWRNAFSFFPNERKKAPWLERLMFRRSLYSTLRGPYRRYQFPREQKRLNWLQYYRKAIFSQRNKKYIKGRRWPKLRIYNQRLHRGFFSLRNTRVAQRHFKKLSRRKPKGSGFSKALLGLADRLDVNLVLLNIAPTIFWAKVLASFGVFRINNKVVCDPAYRFKQNDRIFWNWTTIERLREHFQRPLHHYKQLRIKNTSANFPKNFEYFPSIRTAIYKGLPRPEDLQKNSRLTPFLFKMFRADAGSGK